MKLMILEPFAHIGYFSNPHNGMLVLAHNILNNPSLWDDYNKKFNFIILDNGASEGQCTLESYKKVIEFVQSKSPYITNFELQLPDKALDFIETINMLRQLKVMMLNDEELRRFFNKYRLQGVIQGKNFSELSYCLDFLIQNFDVDTVGIPYRLDRFFTTRLPIVEWLVYTKGIEPQNIHLLGLNWDNQNLEMLSNPLIQECRSIDTSLPIKLAIENINISEMKDVSRQQNYFDVALNEQQIDLAIRNTTTLYKIVRRIR